MNAFMNLCLAKSGVIRYATGCAKWSAAAFGARFVVAGLAACVALSALGVVARAQDLTPKAPPQSVPIVITNATVHPISTAKIENAFVLFDKGVIIAIAPMTELDAAIAAANAEGAKVDEAVLRRIDATGKDVYPGMIAPWTQLGLTEIQSVASTQDLSEVGSITPEACPALAINPDSTLLPVTRSTGVLIAGVAPVGGLIPGQVSAIRLEGWSPEAMTIRATSGVVVNWPQTRIIRAWWMTQSEDEQRENARKSLAQVRDAFDAFAAYNAEQSAERLSGTATGSAGVSAGAIDLRWEAMRGLVPDATQGTDRAMPTQRLFINANSVEQINAAVAFATERGMRPVIVGGREAPQCATLLKELGVPVIVKGTHAMPSRDDAAYDEAFTLPARLQAAGLEWSLANNDDTANERNLPFSAATAVKFGLDQESAMRGITLSAAKVLGIDDMYGSLEVGKSATLIISNGSPLEASSMLVGVFLDGRELTMETKQTKLYEKYRARYEQSGDLKPRQKKAGAK